MPTEVIRFLVMFVVATAAWFIGLYRYGLTGGLIAGFVIALWFATTWVYLGYALRHNATTTFYYWDVFRPKYISEIFLPLGICYLAIVILTFIVDILVRWHQTGTLDRTALGIWFITAIAIPLGYKWVRHGIEGYRNWYKIRTELKVDLRISHYAGKPVAVDRLGFIDSTTNWNENDDAYRYPRLVTDASEPEEDEDDEYDDYDDREQDQDKDESGPEKLVEWEDRIIPLKADKLLISWYSIMEDRYSRSLVSFPLSELDMGDHRGHRFVYGTLDIVICPDGRFELYVRKLRDEHRLVASFTAESRELSDEQKRAFRNLYIERSKGAVREEGLPILTKA